MFEFDGGVEWWWGGFGVDSADEDVEIAGGEEARHGSRFLFNRREATVLIEIVGGARKGFEDAPIGDVLCARDGDFVVAKFGDCELCHGESVVDVFAGGVCV